VWNSILRTWDSVPTARVEGHERKLQAKFEKLSKKNLDALAERGASSCARSSSAFLPLSEPTLAAQA